METEDVISLPASSSPGNGSENNEIDDSGIEQNKIDFHSLEVEVQVNREIPGTSDGIANGDNQLLLATNNYKYMVDNPPTLEVSAETAALSEKITGISSLHTESGHRSVQEGSGFSNHKEDGFLVNSQATGASLLSGVKRPRLTVDDQEPSVQVIYKSLTRDSKQKLEELLQQWSQWHARHCSSANEQQKLAGSVICNLVEDSSKVLESGEETYFPALQVGLDKPSAVSFWMDNETRNGHNKEFISFDGNSVPLYDRGYSLALTSTDGSSNLEGVMEVVEASRCFNCGSYNHSLKECPKPRDNAAVNNARKQHKSRRIQNASARNPTRYYQDSPGGRYDGLKPGALDAETRQVLGLGELDPPPWLNRMREIGYPPGYLDPEDEDQPSGITIFVDEESREEKEEGEILETSFSEPPKKMSVEFPGVNAPIPKSADEKRWAAASSDLHLSRNRSYSRHHRPSDPISRGHYHEQRWSRDYADDEPPPPGCETESPPFSSYSRRYGGYDSGYTSHSSRDRHSAPRSSGFGRSLSERSRRSPLVHDGSPKHHGYGSLPYSSPR